MQNLIKLLRTIIKKNDIIKLKKILNKNEISRTDLELLLTESENHEIANILNEHLENHINKRIVVMDENEISDDSKKQNKKNIKSNFDVSEKKINEIAITEASKQKEKKDEEMKNKQNECTQENMDPKIALSKFLTNDVGKNRIINAIFEAFKANKKDIDFYKTAKIASEIVEEIVNINKMDNGEFLRSKIWNLKNNKNPTLCENVYLGVISPKRYVEMTNDEMKSEELKKVEEKAMHESLMDVQVKQIEAETDIFKCGRCKNRKTTYSQLQTRSADEPMTTFVTCVVCKHRWKF